MATITTTIKEPKTFQQIQDQQNELEKKSALESLNNNISKLINAINERDTKRETEQDRQLKMNQLELSRLQLRRAQLGLAKDEKYYQEYSNKWQSKNNFGTSIGLDHGTSVGLGAIGVSALTGGALNPVIVKQLLFPIVTPLINATKALATFPGLIPMLFRKIGGKSSSAIASDPDRKLHGKLDQILGAIKDKTKSSKAKEEKEQSMLSKFLNALLLGAAGMFAASELLGGADGVIINTLKDYGPAMIAGYALGGWKGALVGLGIQLFGEAIGAIKSDKPAPNLVDSAFDHIKALLPTELQGEFTEQQFKGMVGGLILGGTKGAVVGFALGTQTIRLAIGKIAQGKFDELYTDLSDNIDELKKDTIFESVPSDSILGAISGGIIGSRFGWKGLMIGSILGAVGGFAWDRYKNANLPEQNGFHSEFNPSTLNWELANLGKTWSDFDQEARDSLEQEIKDKKRKGYTKEERLAYTKQLIERAYAEKGVSREGKGFWEATGDYIKQSFVENPIETTIMAGGLMTAAYGLLKSATTHTATSISKLIPNTALSPETMSWIKAGLFVAVAGLIQQATNRVNVEYENRMKTEEGIFKTASDNLFEMGVKAVKDGRFLDAADSFWQGTFAYATEKSLQIIDRITKDRTISDVKQNLNEIKEKVKESNEIKKGYEEGKVSEEDYLATVMVDDMFTSAQIKTAVSDIKGLLKQKGYMKRENYGLFDLLHRSVLNEEMKNEIMKKEGFTEEFFNFLQEALRGNIDFSNEEQIGYLSDYGIKIIDERNEQKIKQIREKQEQEDYVAKKLRQDSERANIEMNEREKENEKKQQPPLVIGDQSSNNEFSGPTSHGLDKFD